MTDGCPKCGRGLSDIGIFGAYKACLWCFRIWYKGTECKPKVRMAKPE